MKHAFLLPFGLAFAATAAPLTAHDTIGAAVPRHMPASWFTPAQKAFIQAKCGVDVDSHQRNLNINGSVMTCPDGRTIDDPQVKAMSDDISRRVNDYTGTILKQADVQRAMALATRENVRAAMADANIDARVADAMARAEMARNTAAHVSKALADARIGQQVRDALARAGTINVH